VLLFRPPHENLVAVQQRCQATSQWFSLLFISTPHRIIISPPIPWLSCSFITARFTFPHFPHERMPLSLKLHPSRFATAVTVSSHCRLCKCATDTRLKLFCSIHDRLQSLCNTTRYRCRAWYHWFHARRRQRDHSHTIIQEAIKGRGEDLTGSDCITPTPAEF